MIDISILKMKIFFFISKLHITASFKYLSSSFLVSFKIFSSLHHYSILLTILPNCAGPILPPAPLQQCRRLNFYKEIGTPQAFDTEKPGDDAVNPSPSPSST